MSGAVPAPEPAARTRGMRSSKLRELIAVTASVPVLKLGGGLPPPEAFPDQELAEAAARVLRSEPGAALQYTATEGDPRLLGLLAEDLPRRLGLPDPSGRLLLTAGSQQALDLVGKVLLDPGDPVVTESPTYVGALRALAAYQPRVVAVPVDDEGMDVAVLADRLRLGLRPKLCYVNPTFSNPSGTTMSPARRRLLAELADRYGFLVVEDDPYHGLRFTDRSVPPVATFGEQVLYLGSFSKVLAPGLRVGYTVAPPWLHSILVIAKQATDLTTSTLSQRLVAELYARSDWWEGHLARLRALYQQRAEALVGAIRGRLVGRLSAPMPEGGMFTWATIEAEGVDAVALARAAMRRGVAVVPGDEFSLDDAYPRSLRLSFSMVDPAGLVAAVARIGLAFDDLAATG